MERDKQIQLMESAEQRTSDYLRALIVKDARVKEALHRLNRDRVVVRGRDKRCIAAC